MDSWTRDRPHYRSHEELVQFESLNTPLWIFDVDRHAMWWGNRRGLAFWRAENLEALLARDYSSDSEIVRTRLRQVVESPTGSSRIQETWTLYPEGYPTTVIVDIRPVLIEDGRHAILLEVSHTFDLQEDPEALRILEAARSSALMVSTFTMSGHLLAQNPASLACYARPVIASSRSDLAGRFAGETISTSILATVEQEGHFEAELAVNTTKGERIHRVLARKGRDPVTGQFVTVLNEEDMTEQATLRRDLQRLNDELEARVAERTERLQALNESLLREMDERKQAEDELRQAQKMEAVGKLTGGVAHDFNNLLAVIQNGVELLARKEGSDAFLTDAVLRATARGAELTQRLLAFSRQQPLRPQVIDLDALVSGMSQMLSRTLGETIEIEVATAPDLWTASADPGQVENALLNLAINARDAMPDGGKLTIECRNAHLDEADAVREPEAVAGDYVVLAVSDTGTGMSTEVLEHVFEPFFTTKAVGQGSGLGLSMIYGFAQQSGGHVTIYSEEGQGTTVKLYLARAEGASQSEETRPSAGIPEGRGEVVLVIEDDPDVRAMAREVLEAMGYRVLAAADAAGARSVLEREAKIDLVLSDVVLPGGTSGPEFAEEVRASHRDLPIIFMSGYPVEASHRGGLLGSGQVLLSKPFQMEQLATALREALDGNSSE